MMEKDTRQNGELILAQSGPATLLSPMDSMAELNRLLREQLAQDDASPTPSSVVVTEPSQTTVSVSDCATEVVTSMLLANDDKKVQIQLQQLFEKLLVIYQQADISIADRKRQYIAAHGLVMAPDQCVTTQTDTHRVQAFIRGIDAALTKLDREQPEGSLRLLYPACGPFAPLLLPLLTYYRVNERFGRQRLQVTLIDMQPGAVASLQTLVQELQIESFIESILCMDGCDYYSERPFDLLVVEAMQHGFSREGHLPLVQHLVSQLSPHGLMIPARVLITAQLAVGQYEFIERWRNRSANELPLSVERIELGEILSLTKESVLQLQTLNLGVDSSLVTCNQVTIPIIAADLGPQLLLVCTQVFTFGLDKVDEYQSGITHPLPDSQVCINFTPSDPKAGDLLLESGDQIKFYYRLNGLPGFLATKGNA
ncbi:hypothetical protein CXF86_15100 [Shewanella sp. GutCb]|uniref:hypothetical protein n=1 Tax=Shewanella sp. GutCb TaxID=2058315 RepID=UPI000C7A742E|nr:hypothetical protein [Shewanella sp. GutCb]PKG74011.1 hypothetical protein CXF86_15100 [Shewanella sp. GutCb]